MKVFKFGVIVLFFGLLSSCHKDESATTPSSTISASVGGSSVSFSASFSSSNGITILSGNSNTTTIQIYIQNIAIGTYTIQPSPNYPYASVSNISGQYTTTTAYAGQLNISQGTTAGLYNGTFYFTATGSAGTITVSNGQFTNM